MQVGKSDHCVSEWPDQTLETENLFLLLAYNQEPTGSRQRKCIGKVGLNLGEFYLRTFLKFLYKVGSYRENCIWWPQKVEVSFRKD